MSTVSLPVIHPPASGAEINRRVLVVDDDPVQRISISCMLERGGYIPVAAEDGQEAIDIFNSEPFSFVLTDWEMPNVDGIGLCNYIRAKKLPFYTYIVMFTARSGTDHIVQGLQSGADDYVAKPVKELELLARLTAGKRLLELEQSLRRANEENIRLSTIDALTGMFNRRYLMDQLAKELSRSTRYKHNCSLVFCDIDHFKLINDKYGHQFGDAALIHVSELLRSYVRDGDWAARYGGEEFAVVLPETSHANALELAEACRQALESRPVRSQGHQVTLTASFGVATYIPQGLRAPDVNVIISAADHALYLSKHQGRNRVSSDT